MVVSDFPSTLSHLTTHPRSLTREVETKEAWKAMDDARAEDFKKNSTFANWGFYGGELVKTGYNIMKVAV